MDGLIRSLRSRCTLLTLAGLSLAIGTGLATVDAGVRVAAPTAALSTSLPGLSWSVDLGADAVQAPGAVEPNLSAHIPKQSPQSNVERPRSTSTKTPSPDPAAAARIQKGYGQLPCASNPIWGRLPTRFATSPVGPGTACSSPTLMRS